MPFSMGLPRNCDCRTLFTHSHHAEARCIDLSRTPKQPHIQPLLLYISRRLYIQVARLPTPATHPSLGKKVVRGVRRCPGLTSESIDPVIGRIGQSLIRPDQACPEGRGVVATARRSAFLKGISGLRPHRPCPRAAETCFPASNWRSSKRHPTPTGSRLLASRPRS